MSLEEIIEKVKTLGRGQQAAAPAPAETEEQRMARMKEEERQYLLDQARQMGRDVPPEAAPPRDPAQYGSPDENKTPVNLLKKRFSER